MKKLSFLLVLFLVLSLFVTACMGNAKEKVVSYEVDPTKITGSTVGEKLDSFRNLLNKQTEGFSKVNAYYNEEGLAVGYSLVIYADYDEKNTDENFTTVARQLFAYTVELVMPDAQYVEIYVFVHSTNSQFVAVMYGEALTAFKNSSKEDWKKFASPPIRLKSVPMTEEDLQRQ